MKFSTELKRGSNFDVTILTKDGSDEWSGETITCSLKPPTAAQIDLAGIVSVDGDSVSFLTLGDSGTEAWELGIWDVEIWRNNNAGSRIPIASGTMNVIASKVTVP
jgi:hypothetical protein